MTETKPRSAAQNLIIAVAAAMALVGGYFLGNMASGKKAELKIATLIPDPRPINDFSLVDYNNQTFTLDNFKGRWSLVFFGYTHCPDICPVALNSMVEVNKALIEENEFKGQFQTVFISVDPTRDTPEHLKNYVTFFNPDFKAATGSETEILALTKQVAIHYLIHEPDENGQYLVDHSSYLILINPQGQFHAVISGSHFPNPKGIAADLSTMAEIH
jgi:protein SCO1/2